MKSWRENPALTDIDVDDTELTPTPSDIVLVLGFDPKEELESIYQRINETA